MRRKKTIKDIEVRVGLQKTLRTKDRNSALMKTDQVIDPIAAALMRDMDRLMHNKKFSKAINPETDKDRLEELQELIKIRQE